MSRFRNHRRWTALGLFVPALTLGFAGTTAAQSSSSSSTSAVADSARHVPPALVERFLAGLPEEGTVDSFLETAKQHVWNVYPQGDSAKAALLEHVGRGQDGRGVAFAAIALIAFRDPATVDVMLARARDGQISAPTRWFLLNAAPYVLSVGDAMYWGNASLDSSTLQFIAQVASFADSAERHGTGRAHARQLRAIFDDGQAKQPQDADYGLALWHVSAHLLGSIDLRDRELLEIFLDPKYGNVFANVGFALGYAANRDFLGALKEKRQDEIPPGAEQAAADSARGWWRRYAAAHPDGDWRAAAREGFAAAGYRIDGDLRSAGSTAELLRAMNAPSDVLRYNAYRLLDDAYGTRFDLESIFMAPKYAMSFLDPMSDQEANEARLKAYWTDRLR